MHLTSDNKALCEQRVSYTVGLFMVTNFLVASPSFGARGHETT